MSDQQGNSEASGQGGEEKPPLTDNPPGYVPPGRGIEDLAGADHAFKLAAHRMEELEQRTQAVSGSSGGFKFDLEAMRALAPEWKDVARELSEILDEVRSLGRANPPAQDEASINQIKSVYDHARVCASIHDQMYQYAYQYATDMETAINKIEAADQAGQVTMRDAGREV